MSTDIREPVKVIGDILVQQLGLIGSGKNSQVMLTNERFNIPVTEGLYIALSYVDGKAIGNNNYFDGNAAVETQQVVMLYHLQIDMLSFNAEARTRKEEVYLALRSLFAQAKMERYRMQIARMPSAFVDASSLEESKMLNRFTMTIAVTAMTSKDVPVTDIYDTFPFQFDENDGGQSPVLEPEEVFFNG